MAARCTKHSFEVAVAQCRSCNEPFCDDCLVYTYGPKHPPFCVPCALVAAGVRRMSKSEQKVMKANRGKSVELDPTAKSLITLAVGTESPKAVAVEDHPDDAVADPEASGSRTKLSLAWVAVVAGLLLILVPFVTGNA